MCTMEVELHMCLQLHMDVCYLHVCLEAREHPPMLFIKYYSLYYLFLCHDNNTSFLWCYSLKKKFPQTNHMKQHQINWSISYNIPRQ